MDRLQGYNSPQSPAAVNLLNAQGSPDEAAKTLNNSVATGMPFSVGNTDPKTFNSETETKAAISASNSDEAVARYLAKNDFAAPVSKDDVDVLASISPLLRPFMRFEKGLAKETWGVIKDVGSGLADIPDLMSGKGQALDPELRARIRDLMRKSGVPEAQIEARAKEIESSANRGQIMQNLLFAVPMVLGSPAIGALKMGSKALEEAGGPPHEVTEGVAMVAGAALGLKEAGRLEPHALEPYRGTGEVPLPGVSPESDNLLIHEAKQDNDQFQEALKGVNKSKTLERSPDAFKAFLDESVQGKEISIPADAIQEVLGDKAAKEFTWLPDFDQQLRTALSTGGDVRIPLNDWLSHGVELADAFKEDIRLRPEGLTLHEAEELEKTEPESYQLRTVAPPVEGELTPQQQHVSDFKSAGAAATNESWLNPLFKDYGLPQQPTEGAKPLFTGPSDLGMPKPMWEKYQKKIQELRDDQDQAAIKYASKEIAKRQTVEWKAEETKRRTDIENDLRYRPDIMADRFFRTGIIGNEKRPTVKLDPELIAKRFGKEVADGLPKGSTVKRGGVDPNDIASMFGFHSGDALVNNLYLLENKRRTDEQTPAQHFKATVDTALAKSMEEYSKVHGDLETNILKEAREAVGTGGQADLLADEMFALQKNWDETQRSIQREDIEAKVKADFNDMSWRDVRSTDFDRAAGKAGRQTEMALLKGDTQTAFQAKQRQFLSVLMAKEARAFEKRTKQGERLFDNYAGHSSIAGVEQEYTDRAHQILDNLQYGVKRAPDELLRALEGKSLESFVQEKLDEGQEVYVAQSLLDPMAAGKTMRNFNYDAISVKDWNDLYDSIKSIDTNGRDVKKLTIAGEAMDLNLKVQEATTQLTGMKDKPIIDPRALSGAKKWVANARLGAQNLKVLQIRPEVMALWFDRLDPNGVFSKMFQSLSDAYGKKLDLDRESSADLKALPKHVTFRGMTEGVENTIGLKYPGREQEVPLTKGNILGLALHMGNDSNWSQVSRGWKIDKDELAGFVHEHMTKPDWDWVQAVWDMFEKRFEPAEEVRRQMSGVGVKKMEPQVVRTPYGDYKGGYLRLKPDPIANEIPRAGKEGIFGEANMSHPSPAGNFMKERLGGDYAPIIDATDIVAAIGETNHYIALKLPLREAAKFYTNKDVRKSIIDKMGREYYDSITPWLQDIASDGTGSRLENDKAWGTLHNIAGGLRRNWTIAELGYRLSTVGKHGLGALSNSIQQVGAIPLGTALKEIWTPGSGVSEQIKAESPMMRNRRRTMDRDMMDVLRRSYGENSVMATLQHHAFTLVSEADYASASATYWADKKNALVKGMDEKEAIAAGERAVRLAHGGGTVVDLPAMLRTNNEVMRLAFVAMTFWNATFNKYMMGMKEVQEKLQYNNSNVKLSRAAAALFLVPVGLALGEELISPQSSDPDESYGMWGLKVLARPYMASIPFARQAAHTVLNPTKQGVWEAGKMTPVLDLLESTVNTGINFKNFIAGDKIKDKQAIRHMIESTTMGGALPVPGAGQLGTALQYITNVQDQKDVADSPSDIFYGLVTGRSPNKPRRGR
jgi:hypothetical protein